MWFKNLYLFRLLEPLRSTPSECIDALEQARFRGCGPLEMSSYGFVSPLGRHSDQLGHIQQGRLLIAGCREERLLPASVIKDFVADRVAEIEEQQMRRVGKRERTEIRDRVIEELLPRAFTRRALTHAYIDAEAGWLVVDSPSARRAEELTSRLRQALGGLPIAPPSTIELPSDVLTGWLHHDQVPPDFDIEDECELRDPENEGGVVRIRRLDLGSDEVQNHLRAGKRVVNLAVTWRDRINCVLTEDYTVRRVKFLDSVLEQLEEMEIEDPIAQLDADFALMCGELRELLPRLLELFGGERPSLG